MPCIIKLKVLEARNLPVMDSSTDLADAYVEVSLGDIEGFRTEIARKTLNPIWNQDFRLEVTDDAMLQDHPLELKVWDYDLMQNDSIGVVYIDLNFLLMEDSTGQIAGWFPIYDTLSGCRGELKVAIKLQFIDNVNPFRESSAGVLYFSLSTPPQKIMHVLGFVEELIKEDDPGHSWTDTFRAPRTSNEARQLRMYTLAGRLRRQMGRKVLELGGNAVLGFKLSFDLEGEFGVVVRGHGTAAQLVLEESQAEDEALVTVATPVPTAIVIPISATANALRSAGGEFPLSPEKHASARNRRLDDKEVQIFTMSSFPRDVLTRVGGVVTTVSVKVLSTRHAEDATTRDMWWNEVREEIRSHARALNCHFVVGYEETTSVQEDLCVLAATGTAVMLNIRHPVVVGPPKNEEQLKAMRAYRRHRRKYRKLGGKPLCSLAHVPYNHLQSPQPMTLHKCNVCQKKHVPEVLLATVEPPEDLPIAGQGFLIEARVCRPKKKATGEANAINVSETVPFLQYDLHRQLINKLRIASMNAIFSLKMRVTVGESMVFGVLSGTAMFCTALPMPPLLQITRNIGVIDDEDKKLVDIGRSITERAEFNRERLMKHMPAAAAQVPNSVSNPATGVVPHPIPQPMIADHGTGLAIRSLSQLSVKIPNRRNSVSSSDGSEASGDTSSTSSDDSGLKAPLQEGSTFVVEIDDAADEDGMAVLLDPTMPPGLTFCTSNMVPGLPAATSSLQVLTAIRRVTWNATDPNHMNQQLAAIFHALYTSIAFRLSMFRPVHVVHVTSDVQMPGPTDVQVVLTAMALVADADEAHDESNFPLDGANLLPYPLVPALASCRRHLPSSSNSNPRTFPSTPNSPSTLFANTPTPAQSDSARRSKFAQTAAADFDNPLSARAMEKMDASLSVPISSRTFEKSPSPPSPLDVDSDGDLPSPKRRDLVEVSPLNYVPHSRILKYQGHVNLFFIKEGAVSGEGGLGIFSHTFLREVMSIAKSTVVAMGGNTLLGFRLNECQILDNAYKSQGYALIHMSGDAVTVGAQRSVSDGFLLGLNSTRRGSASQTMADTPLDRTI